MRFLFLFIATALVAHAEVPPNRPNFILIMADNLGYGDIEPFGSKLHRTPNLDRMAQGGRKLTSFYSASGVCTPSRAALMTGSYPRRVGLGWTVEDGHVLRPVSPNGLHPNEVTIAEVLKKAGYATACIGKWHLGGVGRSNDAIRLNVDEGPYRPENRGFDVSWIYEKGARMAATISHNGKSQRMAGTYPTDLFFKKATEWIDVQRQAKTPFFVYLPPKSPHGPYKEDSSDMPNEDYKKFLGTHPKMTVKNAKIYWEVENIDKRIGEMIKQLETWGIADETLFIFIGSDNGASGGAEIHNAGLYKGKGQPYQGGTRVPAFFRWPGGGIKGGSESAALISQTDIMPTLLELTGTPMTDQLKQQVEGRSLVPLLNNPAADWEKRILVHHVGGWEPGEAAQSKHSRVSIQNERFTLVNNEELYDLSTDPGETKNVIAEHPKVVNQLRKTYDKWWIRMQPGLVNEDAYEPPAK